MFNKTEADEQAYLEKIIEQLEDAYQAVNEHVSKTSKDLQDQKSYMYENKTGMDAAEKAAVKGHSEAIREARNDSQDRGWNPR